MPVLLADSAPTGMGLAIVGIILLAMVGAVLLVAFLVVRAVVRAVRRRAQRTSSTVKPA